MVGNFLPFSKVGIKGISSAGRIFPLSQTHHQTTFLPKIIPSQFSQALLGARLQRALGYQKSYIWVMAFDTEFVKLNQFIQGGQKHSFTKLSICRLHSPLATGSPSLKIDIFGCFLLRLREGILRKKTAVLLHFVQMRRGRPYPNCGFCSNRILHYFPLSVRVLVIVEA